IRCHAARTQDRGRLPQSLPRSPAPGKAPCGQARSKEGPLGPVPGRRFFLLHGAGSAPGNRKVTSKSPDPRWQAARSERLKGCLLFLVNLEELVELGDLEDLKNLRGDIAEDQLPPRTLQLLVQRDQLPQRGAREVLHVAEVQQELPTTDLVNQPEKLLA